MEDIDCIICGSADKKFLFRKNSRRGDPFGLVRCRRCGLRYVSPRPDPEEIGTYYNSDYFTVRTDRGYRDYFSDETRREIQRVLGLNLGDLGFFGMERAIAGEKRALDIGCAAGYAVGYLKDRGWVSRGIDVSSSCIRAAREEGLDVIEGDYLKARFDDGFHLITLWATIEHLHYPHLFLKKIREDLRPGGALYISTCRAGGMNFMQLFGRGWRFYNFPEHLYFFSKGTMKKILEDNGFRIIGYATYGSGLGRPSAFIRRAADRAAKALSLGDMMLLAAQRA